jgi:protein phosphatase PTC6
MKKFGVSAEPEVHCVRAERDLDEYAFMVGCSDGVSGVLSDQEIVDIVKASPNPDMGAQSVVRLAQELGTQDNSTCMAVRLSGWGAPMPDFTKDLRAYRRRESSQAGPRRT